MDTTWFDALTKSASRPGTRRRLVGLLAALPPACAVGGLLGEERAVGQGNGAGTGGGGSHRRRGRARHHPGQDKTNHKGKRKGRGRQPVCTPTTCVAQGTTCGSIPNGCGNTLDCGPCSCATGCHPVCQRCSPATGLCDPVPNETACDDGDICTVNDVCMDGVCAGSSTCGVGEGCNSGNCCLLPAATGATKGLQEAIDLAQSGATLTLCAGNWILSSTVVIGKNLTLVGAGAGATVLDGNNAVRVLHVPRTAVTLQHLTIRNGNPDSGGGGGIFNKSGELSLVGVSVTGNTSTTFGGGIYSDHGTLTLETGCSVTDNTTSSDGGGIYIDVTVLRLQTGSSVTGNRAANAGGGIFNYNGSATLQEGSSVAGNTAGFEGGGFYNHDAWVTLEGPSPSSIVVDNCQDNCAGLDAFGHPVPKCAPPQQDFCNP